jgi:tetratricopeptide (TPR) repeat protein
LQIELDLRAQQYEQAFELARSELLRSPKDFKILTLEGIALSGLGRPRDALKAYLQALAISPAYLAALEGAAQLEYKNNDARAIPLLLRILALRPNDPTSHAMLGVLAFRRRDCATSVSHFRAAGEAIDSQPVALAEYGACLMDLQRGEEALPVFQRVLALLPEDPHARYNLAVVQYSTHHNQAALETLQPMLAAQNPDPDTLDLASSAYEDTEDTPRAVALLRQAIIANPKKARYYLDFAAISFKHSSFEVGVDMLNLGIAQLPDAASLYTARGILYIQEGHFQKGEDDFKTANKLDPRQSSGAVAEGLAQIQESNLDKALATAQEQLKTHPRDYFLHYLKAEILSNSGAKVGTPAFREAISQASQAVELNPNFVLARDLLGNLYLEAGEIGKAEQQCRMALRENPLDQQALYHLIQALRKRGQDPNGEIPAMVKRLGELREEVRKNEAEEDKYRLYEPPAAAGQTAPPAQ